MDGEVTSDNLHQFIIRLSIIQRHLEKAHDNSKHELEKHRKDAKHAALNADPSNKATYKLIKNSSLPTLTALKTNEGLLTADPSHIDRTLQAAWQGVYDGNASSHTNLVLQFLNDYWPQ
eukprot:11530988-Karenia_brevis.AAC.1